MSRIGLIGLGVMGGPVVRDLRNPRHELVGFDIFAKSVDEMAGEGIERGGCAKDAAVQSGSFSNLQIR